MNALDAELSRVRDEVEHQARLARVSAETLAIHTEESRRRATTPQIIHNHTHVSPDTLRAPEALSGALAQMHGRLDASERQMAELIQKTLRARGHTARVFYPFDQEGMDGGIDPLASHLATLQSPRFGCSGRVDRVFFDEALPGREVMHERKTGITNGRWGVYHVAQFPLPLANVTFTFRPSRYNGYFNGTAEQELYRRVVQVGHRKESCEALQAKLYNLSALQSHTRRRLRL